MLNTWLIKLIITTVFFSLSLPAHAIERRTKTEQKQDENYLLLPLPYSYPGVGTGIALLGASSNIFNSETDAYLVKSFGAANGIFLDVDEIYLWKDLFYLHLNASNISKVSTKNYTLRGTESKKEDFNFLEIEDIKNYDISLNLTFFERRLQLFAGTGASSGMTKKVRDTEGNVIATFEDGNEFKSKRNSFGLIFDYTDDFKNPKKGLNLMLKRSNNKSEQTKFDPTFYVLDYHIKYYFPINDNHAFAFGYIASDSIVTKKGLSDEESLKQSIGLECSTVDTVCLQIQKELINKKYIENTKGTATSLGGTKTMRSYPEGRFKAAYSRMIGLEHRWNIINGIKPFDYWLWKDVATAIQLAPFFELGTISETPNEAWKKKYKSYGLGLRLISKSEAVYRLDYAWGDEGGNLTIFFAYPW